MGKLKSFFENKNKSVAQIVASVFVLVLLAASVFPVFGAFNPGDTLDPNCLPTDPSCTVSLSAAAAGLDGYIQFNESGNLAATSSLFWDAANERLGIGTTTPTTKLQIVGLHVSETGLINVKAASSSLPNTGHAAITLDSTEGSNSEVYLKENGEKRWLFGNMGSNDSFRIYEYINGFTALGIQSGTGNVGIGTTTAESKLTVIGTTTIAGVFEVRPSTSTILSFPNTGNLFNVSVASDSSGSRPQYQMERMRGTQAVPLAVQENDYLGSLSFRGYDGVDFRQPAQIDSYVDGVVASGSIPARLSFTTGTNSTDRRERLTIKSNGLVGIGTTTPTALLTVAGTTSASCFSIDGGITCLGGGNGTVSSVGLTVPTGLTVTGSPITSSGTLAIALASGYEIPLTTDIGNWNTAYSWGNHASAGYLGTTTAANTYLALASASGTIANYITSSTTLPASLNYWTKSVNDLQYTSGRVGIGTGFSSFLSNNAQLQVEGPTSSNATVFIKRGAEDRAATLVFYPAVATSSTTPEWFMGMTGSSNDFAFGNHWGTSTPQRLTIQAGTGNVGIGTSTPTTTLDVYGQMSLGTGVRSQVTTFPLYISDATSLGWKVANATGTAKFELYAGYGGLNEVRLLNDVKLVGYQQDLVLGYNSTNTPSSFVEGLRITASGTVAIGTTTPATSTKLHIYSDYPSGMILERELAGGHSYITYKNPVSTMYAGLADSGSFGISSSPTFASAQFTVNQLGNVGIGTTTPFERLTVVGNSYVTGTSTAACFTVDGINCLTAGSGTVNSGLTGQVAFYGANGTAVSGTSTLFISGENIGIGTTTPTTKLQIVGLHVTGTGLLNLVAGSSSILGERHAAMVIDAGVGANAEVSLKEDGQNRWLFGTTGSDDAFRIHNYQSNTTALTIASTTNNVGIGTTTPGSLLTVAGTTTATCFSADGGATCISGGSSGTVTSVGITVPAGLTVTGSPVTASGTIAIGLDTDYSIPLLASTTDWGNFYDTPSTRITAGVGLSWSGNILNATGTIGSGIAGQVAYYGSSGTGVIATSTLFIDNENIGIGTTTPIARLTVSGNSYFVGNSTTTGLLSVLGTGTSTIEDNLWVKGTLKTGTGSMFLNNDGLFSSNSNIGLFNNAASYINGNFGVGTTTPGSRFVLAQAANNASNGIVIAPVEDAGGWVEQTGSGSRNWKVVEVSGDGSKIVAITANVSSYIYTSTDNGVTWNELTNAGARTWMDVAISENGQIIVAGYNGTSQVMRSEDGGATWANTASPSHSSWVHVELSADGETIAAKSWNAGIYVSTDGGDNWVAKGVSDSLGNEDLTMSADGQKIAVTDWGDECDPGAGLKVSIDGGDTWASRGSTYTCTEIKYSPDGSKLFVRGGYGGTFPGSLRVSTDDGANFTELSNYFSHWQSYNTLAVSTDGSTIAAFRWDGSNYRLVISTDSGATWATSTTPGSTMWQAIGMSADGTKIAGGISGGYIYTYQAPVAGTNRSIYVDGSDMLRIGAGESGLALSANGYMGLGTTNPDHMLTVTGSVAFTGLSTSSEALSGVVCLDEDNQLVKLENTGTCTVSSQRFKHDIETLTATSGLAFVNQLRPVSYKLNATGQERVGFIAEEVYALDQRLAFTEGDGVTVRGVRYEEMTAILAKAIQELDAKIASSTFSAATSTSFTESVKTVVATMTEWIGQKVTATLAIFDRVETQTASIANGIEMKDKKTGATYCVQMVEGTLESTPGTCDTEAYEDTEADNTESEPTEVTESTPEESEIIENTASSTPELVAEEIASSTPEVIDELTDTGTSTPETEESDDAHVEESEIFEPETVEETSTEGTTIVEEESQPEAVEESVSEETLDSSHVSAEIIE